MYGMGISPKSYHPRWRDPDEANGYEDTLDKPMGMNTLPDEANGFGTPNEGTPYEV